MNITARILTLLFWGAFFSVSVALAAPGTGVSKAMETAGFTEQQRTQVENRLELAQKNGVPETVMIDKLEEGIAKQVAPDRIIQALDRIASRYSHARQLAGTLTQDTKKRARLSHIVAAGMAAGLPFETVEKIASQVKGQQAKGSLDYQLTKEVMMMARDLSRRGIKPETTLEVVERSLQKGLSASEMRTLRSAFNRQGTRDSIESFARGKQSAGHYGSAHGTTGSAGISSGHDTGMGSDSGGAAGGDSGGGPGGDSGSG